MQIGGTEEGIAYSIVGQPDAEAMANLLADTFSKGEPMAVAVGVPCDQLARLVAVLTPKAISEQLSIIARDTATGHLLGALLADDFGTAPPEGLDHAAPGFAPVAALLDGLDDRYRAATSVRPGTHAHIFMVGVSEAAAGRGVARKLIEVCLDNATRLEYGTALTEATGSASQHIFRKLGFTELLTASYQDFLFNGAPVFSSIQGVAGTLLMARTLNHWPQAHRRSGAV